MSLAHETVAFDVHDAKVYDLLTDVAGASPTYGAAVDVPGIAEVSLDPNLVTAELKGDARVIAKRGRTDRFNFSATYGKLAFDVQEVILGFVVDDVTPDHVRARLAAPAPLPEFALRFTIDDTSAGLGSLHTALYKCQLTGGTLLGQSTDNFGQPTMQLEAIPLEGRLRNAADDGWDEAVMVDFDLYDEIIALPA